MDLKVFVLLGGGCRKKIGEYVGKVGPK